MKGIRVNSLVLCLGVFLFFSSAWAIADDGYGRSSIDQHRADIHRHSHHYYRNGRWYRHGWFGIGVAVPVLPTGVYVDTLPPAYTPVVIRGVTYYYGDNTYFSALPQGGYEVVSTPAS